MNRVLYNAPKMADPVDPSGSDKLSIRKYLKEKWTPLTTLLEVICEFMP